MIYFMILWCITHAVWGISVGIAIGEGREPKVKFTLLGVIACTFVVVPVVTSDLINKSVKDIKDTIRSFKEKKK